MSLFRDQTLAVALLPAVLALGACHGDEPGCRDACPAAGATACESGKVRVCVPAANGCLQLSEETVCGSGACEGTGACARRGLALGEWHSCLLDADGSVACWGRNTEGQSSAPAGEFVQLSGGLSHTC